MIKYVKGDATQPIGEGNKLIIHCCNDENKWGAGFVLALSKRWAKPEARYRAFKSTMLGGVQFVPVESDITVVNMIGQHGIRTENNAAPIRYDAINTALKIVNEYAIKNNFTIHCPRFGAGLAGGDWNVIEALIKSNIAVDVTVYDL
jgi:O-acetyl-ADP-ribose deacetylase (regulator of RNase III)